MVFGIDTEFTGGGGGGFTKIEEVFAPTLGQTIFVLSGAPSIPNDTMLFVNTVKYIYGLHYTVTGNQLTWLNFGFSLDSFDVVEIQWFV